MRLWHQDLISKLPRQQLLGQHRECCALRGNGWGKPHSVVNYVFKYSPTVLYIYHLKVMAEMQGRGYNVNANWLQPYYRGKECDPWPELVGCTISYPEHNNDYLQECIENLASKGIIV